MRSVSQLFAGSFVDNDGAELFLVGAILECCLLLLGQWLETHPSIFPVTLHDVFAVSGFHILGIDRDVICSAFAVIDRAIEIFPVGRLHWNAVCGVLSLRCCGLELVLLA